MVISDGSIVAHVLVVGFHSQLGNRIEFAYPRLRGTPELRSPKLSDTSDISAEARSPTSEHLSNPESFHANPGDWGVLPQEWTFLPFMALPDGVHHNTDDLVFFTLPPDVHCVSYFRQVSAEHVKTRSAGGHAYEETVAARGSVQKSVVLLCRRPLYGVLAARLVPTVRAYFEQADFARTTILSSLYHSLNVSLSSRPSLRSSDSLFNGLNLRSLVNRIGPNLLTLLKLILLERRVVVHSQPVRDASNAVMALASIFHGSLDSIAPTMPPSDSPTHLESLGLPLNLFSRNDRVVLQPYSPLPLLSKLLRGTPRRACLLGTSHNVGMLLVATATSSAARRGVSSVKFVQSSSKGSAMTKSRKAGLDSGQSAPAVVSGGGSSSVLRGAQSTLTTQSLNIAKEEAGDEENRPPVVDAIVDIGTGKVSVSGSLEPLCRITKAERTFMRDLVHAVISSSPSSSSGDGNFRFIGSDDHIRARLREYICNFLQSASSVNGILSGPPGGGRWSSESVKKLDLSALSMYNERFVRTWLCTHNGGEWVRKCRSGHARSIGLPPLLYESESSGSNSGLDGWSGLRQNLTSRLNNFFSAKTVDGISTFFGKIEQEVARIDSAIVNSRRSSMSAETSARDDVNRGDKRDGGEEKR